MARREVHYDRRFINHCEPFPFLARVRYLIGTPGVLAREEVL
jgi:hypothetical protein